MDSHDDTIANMLGTAYNVLQEQEHPDMAVFEAALLAHQPRAEVAFDLRFRTAEGERL